MAAGEKAFTDAVLYGLLRIGKPEITLKAHSGGLRQALDVDKHC